MTAPQSPPSTPVAMSPNAVQPDANGKFPTTLPAVRGGVTVVAFSMVFVPFTILAVILRLWARRINKKRLELNDYMAVTACIFAVANSILTICAVYFGAVGRHLLDVLPYVPTLMKYALALSVTWTVANTAIKISIIHLYIVIFHHQKFRWASYGVLGLTGAYCLTNILLNLLLCRPLQYHWDKTIDGTCLPAYYPYVSSAIIHVVIDIIIVALPLTMLWRLQMDTRRKIALTFIFGMGTLICIISAVRIHSIATLDFQDFSYAVVPDAVYSVLEPCLGTINACLPVLQPVATKLTHSKLYSLIRGSSRGSNYYSKQQKYPVGASDTHGSSGAGALVRISANTKSDSDGYLLEDRESSKGGTEDRIKVISDWHVASSSR